HAHYRLVEEDDECRGEEQRNDQPVARGVAFGMRRSVPGERGKVGRCDIGGHGRTCLAGLLAGRSPNGDDRRGRRGRGGGNCSVPGTATGGGANQSLPETARTPEGEEGSG